MLSVSRGLSSLRTKIGNSVVQLCFRGTLTSQQASLIVVTGHIYLLCLVFLSNVPEIKCILFGSFNIFSWWEKNPMKSRRDKLVLICYVWIGFVLFILIEKHVNKEKCRQLLKRRTVPTTSCNCPALLRVQTAGNPSGLQLWCVSPVCSQRGDGGHLTLVIELIESQM